MLELAQKQMDPIQQLAVVKQPIVWQYTSFLVEVVMLYDCPPKASWHELAFSRCCCTTTWGQTLHNCTAQALAEKTHIDQLLPELSLWRWYCILRFLGTDFLSNRGILNGQRWRTNLEDAIGVLIEDFLQGSIHLHADDMSQSLSQSCTLWLPGVWSHHYPTGLGVSKTRQNANVSYLRETSHQSLRGFHRLRMIKNSQRCTTYLTQF